MKLVVSTHAKNQKPLCQLLWSLRSNEHLDEIIVSVAGVSEAFDAGEFASAMGVRHVITHPSNSFEYTAFVALTEALWRRPELHAEHYVFVHDTVQAASGFWEILAGFEPAAGVVWYPFCDNFNMGIAAVEFVTSQLYVAYRGLRLDKAGAIDIELNRENPLNLRRLAGDGGHWRYAFGGKKMLLGAERPWANDTDVYGDGVARCPTRVALSEVAPLLYKFVHLHDLKPCPKGFVWDFENCCGKN